MKKTTKKVKGKDIIKPKIIEKKPNRIEEFMQKECVTKRLKVSDYVFDAILKPSNKLTDNTFLNIYADKGESDEELFSHFLIGLNPKSVRGLCFCLKCYLINREFDENVRSCKVDAVLLVRKDEEVINRITNEKFPYFWYLYPISFPYRANNTYVVFYKPDEMLKLLCFLNDCLNGTILQEDKK